VECGDLLEGREGLASLLVNLLVRIHFIFVMIRWTGLAPWELEFPFPGSLTSTFLGIVVTVSRAERVWRVCSSTVDEWLACSGGLASGFSGASKS